MEESLVDCSDVLREEIMLLDSIHPEEFDFSCQPSNKNSGNCSSVFRMTISPATAGDATQQNVSITLELLLSPNYPSDLPVLHLLGPRGLSDLQLMGISQQIHEEAEKRRGHPMIYDLVDLTRQYLTETNFPNVECPFCLCFIEEGESFYRTECFHYFHSYCLREYLTHLHRSGQSLCSCIVCRCSLSTCISRHDIPETKRPKGMDVGDCDAEKLLDDLESQRMWRTKLFEQQKLKNGIIKPDPKEELVLTLEHIPELANSFATGDGQLLTENGGSVSNA